LTIAPNHSIILEKPSFENRIHPLKGVLQRTTHNLNVWVAHHYSIVEYLAKGPHEISTLEVLYCIRRGFSLHFPLCIINCPYFQHYTLGSHHFYCFNCHTLLVLLTHLLFFLHLHFLPFLIAPQPCLIIGHLFAPILQHPWLRIVVTSGHHLLCFLLQFIS
jgi:hypothetical protein